MNTRVQGQERYEGERDCYTCGKAGGPMRYGVRITVPEGESECDANVHETAEFFACDNTEHLGDAVDAATRNNFGTIVSVVRFRVDLTL